MRVYTYSEAKQHFASILNIARTEEVIIKRRSGETFSIIFRKHERSPFDVPGIHTNATTHDILEAVKESRGRFAVQGSAGDEQCRSANERLQRTLVRKPNPPAPFPAREGGDPSWKEKKIAPLALQERG